MRLLVIPVLVGLLSLAGCGGDASSDRAEPAAPTTAPTTAPASETPSTPEPVDTERALAAAVEATLGQGVAAFGSTTTMQGTPMIVTEGAASGDGEWEATTTISLPGEDVRVMRARSTAKRSWMQMDDWPADQRSCWLAMEPDQVPLNVTALRPTEPLYLGLLAHLTATGDAPTAAGDALAAGLGVQLASALFPGLLMDNLAVDWTQADTTVEVEASVEVADGMVGELRLEGADLAAALREAGVTITGDAATALPAVDVVVAFPASSPRLDVDAPDPATVIGTDGVGCVEG